MIVRGVEQVKKNSAVYQALLRYVSAPNPTTVLVLVQGAGEKPDAGLARDATAVAVEPLPPERVARWTARRAGQLGLTLEPDAATLLQETVGHDLASLARELEKLAAATAGRAATREDVAALVGVRRGATLPDLVDAALRHDAPSAAHLVDPVLDARLPDVVFRHIIAARPFGLGNWKEEAARWAEWARLWRPAALRRALRQALAADQALKSSTVSDDRAIVTELLLTMAVSLREAA